MIENQETESYGIHDGVLYVRDFKEKPDYYELGGFDGIHKIERNHKCRLSSGRDSKESENHL